MNQSKYKPGDIVYRANVFGISCLQVTRVSTYPDEETLVSCDFEGGIESGYEDVFKDNWDDAVQRHQELLEKFLKEKGFSTLKEWKDARRTKMVNRSLREVGSFVT